ncbi:hypothetical protein [Symbiopectobacterium purcellii]|uniref:Uncharacterized protein n=1 Tax=Symbiopectobacterium purcellii TaxID=2871826 RepID=A0ABX9AHC0_9ENTR|nr:hypothetical protein [Symbiopectobacterium purcellii]QZN94508.1 hypothetical protein K6K13_14490 [Symbiopectobacterium purcellii]
MSYKFAVFSQPDSTDIYLHQVGLVGIEEEQAEREALIAADHEKMQVEFTRRLNDVWGNLSAVTDGYRP